MRPRTVLCLTAIVALCCVSIVSADDSISLGGSLGVAGGLTWAGAGSAQYEAMTTGALGFRYSTALSERSEFEIGVSWLAADARKTHYPMPGLWDAEARGRLRLLTIPVTLRRRPHEHVSFEYSAMLDVDASPGDVETVVPGTIRSRSGVGLGFGVRVEPSAGRRWRFFVNPYLALHSLVPLNGNSGDPRVCEVGVRVGVRLSLATAPH